jgi:hypothetical protein
MRSHIQYALELKLAKELSGLMSGRKNPKTLKPYQGLKLLPLENRFLDNYPSR